MRRIVEIVFMAGVVLAVAGFGGTAPLPWSIAQALVFIGAILLLLSGRSSKAPQSRVANVAVVGLTVWVICQWVGSHYGVFGLDSYAIRFRGLAFAAAFAAYFVSREIARDRSTRNRLALSLIALAIFESVYGLAQNPGGWQYIWTYRRIYYTGSATGTYINHNHFAAFLEMVLPIALALALYHWNKRSQSAQDQGLSVAVRFFRRIGSPDIFKSSVMLLVAIFLFVAIVFSLSRMGLVAAISSIFFILTLTLFARNIHPINWKLILGSVLVSVLIVVWIGVRPVMEHFARLPADESMFSSEGAQGRLDVWRDAARLVRLRPLTGVGLGCFEFAFTRVQSSQLMLIIDHAHNDYLELAVEIGVPAAVFLFSLIASILLTTVRSASQLTSRRDSALAIGCISGAGALLLHSLVDFNLYIPANALVLAVLLGICRSLSDKDFLAYSPNDACSSVRTTRI